MFDCQLYLWGRMKFQSVFIYIFLIQQIRGKFIKAKKYYATSPQSSGNGILLAL